MKTVISIAIAAYFGISTIGAFQRIQEEPKKIWCDYAAHEAYIKLSESPSQNMRAPDYDHLCRCLEWKQ